jgi:hypothetical protein
MTWKKPLEKSIIGGILAVIGLVMFSGIGQGRSVNMFPYDAGPGWNFLDNFRPLFWGALVAVAGGVIDGSVKIILFDTALTGLITAICHYLYYKTCIFLGEATIILAYPLMVLFLGLGLSLGISTSRLLLRHFQSSAKKEVYALLRRTVSTCGLCLCFFIVNYNWRIFDFAVRCLWGHGANFPDIVVSMFGLGAGLYLAEIWEQD